jgi:hypothetical protein
VKTFSSVAKPTVHDIPYKTSYLNIPFTVTCHKQPGFRIKNILEYSGPHDHSSYILFYILDSGEDVRRDFLGFDAFLCYTTSQPRRNRLELEFRSFVVADDFLFHLKLSQVSSHVV